MTLARVGFLVLVELPLRETSGPNTPVIHPEQALHLDGLNFDGLPESAITDVKLILPIAFRGLAYVNVGVKVSSYLFMQVGNVPSEDVNVEATELSVLKGCLVRLSNDLS